MGVDEGWGGWRNSTGNVGDYYVKSYEAWNLGSTTCALKPSSNGSIWKSWETEEYEFLKMDFWFKR